jgi:hypothetical protein
LSHIFVVDLSSWLLQKREGDQRVRQSERKEPIVSTEEIIRTWKHNEDEAEKQPEGEQPPTPEGKKPLKGKKKPGGKAPSNPAGEQELSDEALEAVEGGDDTVNAFSCWSQSC